MESFDKTPQNEVFAIRNIGNQIVTCEGSVDFGVRILRTPFLLIMGHSACGAVKAALSGGSTNVASVDAEVKNIKIKSTQEHLAVLENIYNQVDYAMQKYFDLVESGALTVFGAVYDFKNDYGFGTGKIVFVSINGQSNYQIIKSLN
jgi:carbonic anhydrase